ncbi:hypothetical protein F4561_002295 [Lipingzhangella halophila]|uniref:Uncharacterized protein n=1 Tax=Lipingzhangella halophila TaxID=1783352 RepID=A0A7W7RGI1_9ACTN|nr:hypothetical protein [Lipingzhangella halophila]MBB4931475.1 hypothetical protein [Lipingzhangella halophila]
MDFPAGTLVNDAYPGLTAELATLLRRVGEHALAATVGHLRIHSVCRCGQDGCRSFYTASPPDGPWGSGHRNVELPAEDGMLVLDVVSDEITFVEVLDRD